MKNYFALIFLLIFTVNSTAQNPKKLGFIFDTKSYDFGDVEQWHNQPAIFTFTNKTKHPVSFLPLFNENDLDVVLPEKPIKVGESVVIKAMYYTAEKGHFNRKFSIYFGSLAEPIILKVTGNIKSLSPEAYINCPMSKPELAKAKIELIGDVAEIDTEIPLSGTSITIVGLQNNKNITLYSSSRGKFGTKLPVGNYQVTVNHPNYYSYTGPFYIGQTSPPLRIRLTPIVDNPVFAHNNEPLEYTKTRVKEDTENLDSKEDHLKTSQKEKELKKVAEPKKTALPKETFQEEPVKDTPKDNPYSRKENETPVPNTLTTYKESKESEPKKVVQQEKPVTYEKTKESVYNKEIAEKTPEKIDFEREPKKDDYKKPNRNSEPKETEKKLKEKNQNKVVVEKVKKEKPIKAEKPIIPMCSYTFRVIDKKTMDPISDASIFIFDIYNKSNKHKDKSDERGYSEMEITKEDYRFIASADGYISNEIRILKDDRSDVFRIELEPVSSLYDEIYEAKKAQQKDDQEVLEKLSFGKTTFSFAKDEDESTPELIAKTNDEPSTNLRSIEEELKKEEAQRKENALRIEQEEFALLAKEQKAKLEKTALAEKEAKMKEDSLKLVIAQLALDNKNKEKELAKVNDNKDELSKIRAQEKVDSLNNYIAQLLNKNNDLEKDLDKINNEKDDLVIRDKLNKEQIEDLNAINKELQEPEDKSVLSKSKYAANNIIFLIDVSTSMGKAKKMEMLQNSIKNLSAVLRDIDRVAIIAYNQKSRVILESIDGNNKEQIYAAIDSLKTGGLTNGVRGITAAYEMLDYYHIPDGNNQIILATDGLFSKYNNEMTETELNRLVKKQAEKNMKLTVVGFGKDEEGKELMSKLAKNGSGQYIQIKNEWMTKDVLIKEVQLNSKK